MDSTPHLLLGYDARIVLGTVHFQPASVLVLGLCHRLQVCAFYLLSEYLTANLSFLGNTCVGCLEEIQGLTAIHGLGTVVYHGL